MHTRLAFLSLGALLAACAGPSPAAPMKTPTLPANAGWTEGPELAATARPAEPAIPGPAASTDALAVPEVPGMVLIPEGTYWTGCDKTQDVMCRPDEGEFRQVYLDAYYMDVYEVTVDDYAKCVAAGACDAKNLQGFDGAKGAWADWVYCNWGKPGKGNHPLNCVGWNQASTYCGWADKRLPTEAEWEKAARGTDKRMYPWGDEALTCEYAITNEANDQAKKGCGANSTFPVGSRPKGQSPYGIHDIVGNVWEWTADWYDPTFHAELQPDRNPTGPASGTEKVGKGGCWGSGNPWNSRVSWRHHYDPSYRSNVRLGFRCAKSV